MRDVVLEWYIPYFPDRKKQLLKAVMISATLVCIFDAVFFAAGMLYLAIILAIADFFLFRSWKYEYEYVYVNGEFDISKIIRNAKRKDVYRLDRLDIEDYIPGRASAGGKKTRDFTSGRPGASVYTIMAKGEAVYIEPSEEFTEEISRYHRVLTR
jgi:hypothetical protein